MYINTKRHFLTLSAVVCVFLSTGGYAARGNGSYDRIILNISSNPATSAAVSWRSNTGNTGTVAQIARATAGEKPSGKIKSYKGKYSAIESDSTDFLYHSSRIGGLEPETSYAYRVGNEQEWSKWHFFQTASANGGSFSFIYFGDLQNRLVETCKEVVDKAYNVCPDAAFAIKVGDLVNYGSWDQQWEEWYIASDSIVRRIPIAPLPGNHEYGGSLTPFWKVLFALPENGPKGLNETAYYFDCNGVRIVALNSMEKIEEQAQWLDNVLKDHTNNWTIVSMHYPLYSSTGGRDNRRLRKHWQPVFDKRNVDLVFAGHDHTYSRTGFMKYEADISHCKEASESEDGTIYITSVTGSKFYPLDHKPYMRCSGEKVQLFQIINIEPRKLEYISYTKNGKMYDNFTLEKDKEGKTRLTEEKCSHKQQQKQR